MFQTTFVTAMDLHSQVPALSLGFKHTHATENDHMCSLRAESIFGCVSSSDLIQHGILLGTEKLARSGSVSFLDERL